MSGAIAWDELDRRADAVAGRLRDLGVSRGSVVALGGAASIETAAAILGIVRAGAVAAPLPAGRTAPETAAALALLDPVLFLGRDEPVRDGRTLDAPGVVVLTSGTTAAPKGVVLSVDALDASAAAWLAALPPASGWLLALGTRARGGDRRAVAGCQRPGADADRRRPTTRRPSSGRSPMTRR